MAKGRTEIVVEGDGVAIITLINPPVNSLSLDVLFSLKDRYEEAIGRDDVKAIVITGAGGKFSGGIDLTIFDSNGSQNIKLPMVVFGSIEMITNTLEGARKPTVAAISGLALGGGLEVAMACHGRISTAGALLGLPEIPLGVIPGLGGTQRLPRLVGLSKALQMILMSKLIKSEEAHGLGLIDAIVPSNELINTARCWALDIAESRKPWIKTLDRMDKIESIEEARELLNFSRLQARKRAPDLEHPLICIDVIEEGIVFGPRAGLWKEANAFYQLINSDACKSLIHVFFSQRATSKVPGITDLSLMPRNITRVAIIGGGLIGSEIATTLMLRNCVVILKEAHENLLRAGIDRVKANLQSYIKKGKMTDEKCKKIFSLITGVLDYESFKDIDIVIEAVTENMTLKQQIFAELEKYCSPHCILASNTSTIYFNLIGEKTRCQDRIIAANFFSPTHFMPLLEIARTQKTSPQIVVDLLDIGKKIRKTPIVVGNCTGFTLNWMFFSWIQSALFLVDHGLDVYRIDEVCTKFGMTMGPFRLADLVGLEVAVSISMQYHKSFPERCYKSLLMGIMLHDHREGETTQKGFYVYDEKKKARPDPKLKKLIEKSRNLTGISPSPEIVKFEDKDIVEMMLFPAVNEACRILNEGVAVKASDLDISSIMGMGFPPYRGGIMFWADALGANYIEQRLEGWSEAYGEFFKPCSYLIERASKGIPLSAPLNTSKARL